MPISLQHNVLDQPLQPCSFDPVTGFYRNGCCETGPDDLGEHTVCVVVTTAFLEFSRRAGNDLSTPRPEYAFAGLRAGDRWCLCADRWIEALLAGVPPKVVLAATHEAILDKVSLETLVEHAFDWPPAKS